MVLPKPIIPLEIKARAHGNGSRRCCLLIRQRGIQHNVNHHIALLLCVFLRLVYAADIYFGGLSEGRMMHHGLQIIKLQLTLAHTSP